MSRRSNRIFLDYSARRRLAVVASLAITGVCISFWANYLELALADQKLQWLEGHKTIEPERNRDLRVNLKTDWLVVGEDRYLYLTPLRLWPFSNNNSRETSISYTKYFSDQFKNNHKQPKKLDQSYSGWQHFTDRIHIGWEDTSGKLKSQMTTTLFLNSLRSQEGWKRRTAMARLQAAGSDLS